MRRGLGSLGRAAFLAVTACGAGASAQPAVTTPHPRGIDARAIERRVSFTVEADGRVRREERRVIEVLTDCAMETYSDPVFVYDAARQRLEVTTARTIRPDGSALEPPPFARNELTLSALAAAPAFAPVRALVVSLLGIDIGARTEIAWTVEDTVAPPGGTAEGEAALDWTIPVESLEVVVSVPSGTPLRHACRGCDLRPETSEADGRTVYRWRSGPREAVNLYERSEPVGSPEEGLSGARIVWSTAPSWAAAAARWRPVDGDDDPDDRLRVKARSLVERAATARERVEALQAFVAEGTLGTEWPRGLAVPAPAPAGTVLARSYGTPLERAMLLAALLESAGVPATAMASGDPIEDDGVPFLGDFRSAWVRAESGGDRWWLPVDRRDVLAERALPSALRLLDPAGAAPILVRAGTEADVAASEATVALDAQGRLTGTARISLAGRSNPWAALRTADGDPAVRLGRAAAAVVPAGSAEATTVAAFGPDGAAATATIAGSATSEAPGTWTIAFGRPGADPFPAGMHRGERDLDLPATAPSIRRTRLEVRLPRGWRAAMIPATTRVDTAYGRFEQSARADGDRVVIERTLELNGTAVPPSGYAAFRRLHRAWVTAGAEPTVVERSTAP